MLPWVISISDLTLMDSKNDEITSLYAVGFVERTKMVREGFTTWCSFHGSGSGSIRVGRMVRVKFNV